MKPVFTCTDCAIDAQAVSSGDGLALSDSEIVACDLCGFSLTPDNVSWDDGNYCDDCDYKMNKIAAYGAI
jgi:hypothetical protein